MTVEEDRLSNWLHAITPEPPNAVHVETLRSRLVQPQRKRAWAPALAAVCVVALALGLVAAFQADRPDRGVGNTGGVLVVHPWHARQIGNAELSAYLVLGHGSMLYGLTKLGDIVAVDPATGSRLNQTSGVRGLLYPVYAGGRIWAVKNVGAHRAELYGFDLSLRDPLVRTVSTEGYPGQPSTILLSAPVDGEALYFGTGRRVLNLDPNTGHTRRQYTLPTPIDWLAASPDGKRVYALNGQDRHGSNTAATMIDAAGQHVLARNVGLTDLAASDTGFFASAIEPGHGALTGFFYPATGAERARVAGGSSVPLTHSTGGVLWSVGDQSIRCSDPATGAERAHVTFSGHSFFDLAELDGHLYASYTPPHRGVTSSILVELTPPRACGLR